MLFLTLNAFSSTGGIQKVSRSMSHALHHISKNRGSSSFRMLAMDDDKIADTRYISQHEFKGFRSNKLIFALKATFDGAKTKTVILSHINLLFIAVLIRILNKKTQFVLMAHGKEVWTELSLWKRKFINKYVVIWAVSNYTAAALKKQKINSDQIKILPNCIDPFFKIPKSFQKPERLLKRYQLSKHQPVILSIGRLTKFETDKGYNKVIGIIPQLLSEFPDLSYLICGQADAKEKTKLIKLVDKHRLQKNIKLLDFIPETELEAYYQLADIFGLPSKKEGFGLVFIEAAVCGSKVISGNIDGSADAMLNGQLGIMVDPDDTEQLRQAITQALKERLSESEARNIQRACLNSFSHDQYIKNIKKLLTEHE